MDALLLFTNTKTRFYQIDSGAITLLCLIFEQV